MAMTDEPGLPETDEDRAALMVRLVKTASHANTADGRAGLKAFMRELHAADPAAVERLASGVLGRSSMTVQ